MKNAYKNTGFQKLPSILALMVLCLVVSPPLGASTSRRASSRTLRSTARIYMAFGNYEKAYSLASEALVRAQEANVPESELAMCLIDLGTVYQYQEQFDRAQAMLAAGIAVQKRLPETNPWMAHTLRMLSSVHRRQHQYEQAQTLLDEAVSMLDDRSPCDPSLVLFRGEQGRLFLDQGRLSEAQDIYGGALADIESVYGTGHLCTAGIYEDVAELDLRQGRFGDARARIEKTIRIRERYYGQGRPELISAWLMKARICRAAGDISASEQSISKALAVAAAIKDPVRQSHIHRQASDVRSAMQLASL